jgi:hypothetical protein
MVVCRYMLMADIYARLRHLRPVAACLSLFSLLVVEEDAWGTFVVLAGTVLLPSAGSRL